MKRFAVVFCVLVALASTPATGLAQEHRGNVAGGWQYQQAFDTGGEDVKLTKGFFIDAAGNVTPIFAVIGEFSAGFKAQSDTFANAGVTFDVAADLRLQTFMGGIRVGAPPRQALRPFAQVLVGGLRRSAEFEGTATVGGVTISESDSDSATDFAFDLGAGVDFWLKGGVGLRAKAGYLRVTGDDGGNAFRFQAGVVVPF